jgi:hypothetical protein
LLLSSTLFAQQNQSWKGKFEQLDQTLPTPNSYRTGSGAPGPAYWQQRADYIINAEVDDNTQMLTASETITYYNNSPESLSYLWLQLDQNIFADQNMTDQTSTGVVRDSASVLMFGYMSSVKVSDYKGGYTIKSVKDIAGKGLPYVNHDAGRSSDANENRRQVYLFDRMEL